MNTFAQPPFGFETRDIDQCEQMFVDSFLVQPLGSNSAIPLKLDHLEDATVPKPGQV